jgi:hypothetical protein
MSDVHIVGGMGAIINTDNIRPGINVHHLERQMIDSKIISAPTVDPIDRYNSELQLTAKRLGISFDDDKIIADTGGNGGGNGGQSDYTNADDDDEDDEPEPLKFESSYNNKPFNDDLNERTMEQKRREHIKKIVGSDEREFSLEKEKKEDMKSAMLAEIDSLMDILTEVDIDLSRIPQVSQSSSFEAVESVLRILRHKNDATRYTTFAEEILLMGVHALEELFDGKRMWFDKYQPDLTGWHNTVNSKLKRMRHDTGQIVSSIMHDYQISPGVRIMMELVPNMILYSNQRKEQHNQPGWYDAERDDAKNILDI